MGCILEKTAYEMETAVNCFDVDRYDRLKISALMKLHQEIGERHVTEFGTSSAFLRDKLGVAFIFTKLKIKIHRLPKTADNIKVLTWCSELKGIRFYRNYIVMSENNELLTETKAEVVIMNRSDRRLVRPKEVEGFGNYLYNYDLVNGCEKPSKVDFPEAFNTSFKRQIRFSDIDFNGHVNNTVYADICFDCLDGETLKKTPKSVEINFVNEIMPDEELCVSFSSNEQTKLFSGSVSDRHCFTAKIEY